MGAGHTPGPWLVNCSHIYAPDGAIIAQVHNPGSKASDYPLVANRDLMAAAPELLDVLVAILANSDEREAEGSIRVPRVQALYDQATAAIAKARGEA